ncbi:MAG TPA: hypothetical protein VF212_10610 [Longimicrobiales bacterium]
MTRRVGRSIFRVTRRAAHRERDTHRGIVEANQKHQIFMLGTERMWDTCAVELRVNLPRAVAAEIEDVQRRDPEVLSRILVYGLTRRAIFEHLAKSDAVENQ